ncbi:serine/threonine-protein kinase [Frankia sp. QA3]|uniref:serine/threonine-protein kinase n=1 Tax=Frankia sp. QA3 TaxID=710111 RepID=UPI0012F751B5|nr:serine/threonine-protein kinase [Frankia sp. QA3]
MGMVYLASDPTGDPVAVKVIRPEVTGNPMFRDRFRREVTAARRVPRFCTAAVRDADPDGNPPYLVTDYVPGPTLSRAVRTTPLKGAELEQVAVNIATALAVIHGAGVVHRDLKPSNVILSPTGARVIDFGIAIARDMTMLTVEQIGTPEFMAPEAFDAAPPSPAMDVFAWGGVVLYAATRTPPFPSEPAALLPHRIRHEHPAHLYRLPEPLRSTVTAAMAKQPENRPTAEQLYRLLTGTVPPTLPRPPGPDGTGRWVPDVTRPQNPAVLTRPPTPPSPHAPANTPPPRRRRTLIAGSLAAAIAVLAATAFTLGAEHHTGSGTLTAAQRTTAARTLAAAATAQDTDPALAERLAVAAWHLNPAASASANALLSTTAGRLPPLSTTGHAGPITTAVITADGRTLATSSKDHTARLWDLTTPGTHPTLLATLPHAAAVTAISINPPGTLAATTSDDNTLHLWNIRDRANPTPAGTYTLNGAGHPIAAVFTPTSTFALTTSTGDLFTLDITDPAHLTTLATVATVHAHDDAATAQPILNSNFIATASTDGTARLWDLTNPHTPQPLTHITPTSTPINLAISPDGHTLATAGVDGTISLWNISHPTTPEPLTTLTPTPRRTSSLTDLTGLTDAASAVAFNQAGTLLATADATGALHLWTLTDPHNPRPLATLKTHAGTIRDVTFTPDSTHILTAGDDSTARLWDLNPTSLYQRACTTNQLTPVEWNRYLPHTTYQPPCPPTPGTTSPPAGEPSTPS